MHVAMNYADADHYHHFMFSDLVMFFRLYLAQELLGGCPHVERNRDHTKSEQCRAHTK